MSIVDTRITATAAEFFPTSSLDFWAIVTLNFKYFFHGKDERKTGCLKCLQIMLILRMLRLGFKFSTSLFFRAKASRACLNLIPSLILLLITTLNIYARDIKILLAVVLHGNTPTFNKNWFGTIFVISLW